VHPEIWSHKDVLCAVGMGAGEAIKAEEAGAVAVPTAAVEGASSNLTSKKQSAVEFNAEQIPLSSFILNGVDYTAARSVKVAHNLDKFFNILMLPKK
jgi:hypothetical protein